MELRWHGEGLADRRPGYGWVKLMCWWGRRVCDLVSSIILMTWTSRLGGLSALCSRRNTVDWAGGRPGTNRWGFWACGGRQCGRVAVVVVQHQGRQGQQQHYSAQGLSSGWGCYPRLQLQLLQGRSWGWRGVRRWTGLLHHQLGCWPYRWQSRSLSGRHCWARLKGGQSSSSYSWAEPGTAEAEAHSEARQEGHKLVTDMVATSVWQNTWTCQTQSTLLLVCNDILHLVSRAYFSPLGQTI